MNYYLMFEKFEENEGSFTVQKPWNGVLQFYHPNVKLVNGLPGVAINTGYDECGISDFIKVPLGMLASPKIQQVFFEQGFSGIQFVPVDVNSDVPYPGLAFINATAHYDLLDVEASQAEDMSETLGGYTSVLEEVIDEDKLNAADIQHDCFTLSNYKDPYFVSERVVKALEAAKVTGIEFIPMEFA